jgi:hypothetical protein
MREMKALLVRSVVAVILGVGLIGGLAYSSPSQIASKNVIAAPAAADFGRGGLNVASPQTLGSIAGSQPSLALLFIVLATSAVLATSIFLISRRAR